MNPNQYLNVQYWSINYYTFCSHFLDLLNSTYNHSSIRTPQHLLNNCNIHDIFQTNWLYHAYRLQQEEEDDDEETEEESDEDEDSDDQETNHVKIMSRKHATEGKTIVVPNIYQTYD